MCDCVCLVQVFLSRASDKKTPVGLGDMNRPKKAKASSKRLHAAQRGGGGGSGSGNGGSGTSPKKQRRDTNKQSAKQVRELVPVTNASVATAAYWCSTL